MGERVGEGVGERVGEAVGDVAVPGGVMATVTTVSAERHAMGRVFSIRESNDVLDNTLDVPSRTSKL